MDDNLKAAGNTLLLKADLEALAEIKSFLKIAAAEAGLDDKQLYHLRLVVVETATNIIDYGYPGPGRAGLLRLSIQYNERVFRLCLEDDGEFFDPTQVSDPDTSLALSERPMGGLGTFLARHYVDELTYQKGANGNLTTFTIYRPEQEGKADEIQN